MQFEYVTNNTCHNATGLVVVIDVLRAFSNAAYAFGRGAESITLVGGVDEALHLKAQMPGALVIGEVDGLPPEGFDFGNSPAEIVQHDLSGQHLIQRTTAGTQGVVRSVRADVVFASSFVVAEATLSAILRLNSDKVTFVVTGRYPDGEDRACAEYLEERLRGRRPDPEPYLARVRNALELRHMPCEQFPTIDSDVDYCTRLDAFPFAMPVLRENNRHVMRAKLPEATISR